MHETEKKPKDGCRGEREFIFVTLEQITTLGSATTHDLKK